MSSIALLGLLDNLLRFFALFGRRTFRFILGGLGIPLVTQMDKNGQVIRTELRQDLHVHEAKVIRMKHMIQRPPKKRQLGVKGAEETAPDARIEHDG